MQSTFVSNGRAVRLDSYLPKSVSAKLAGHPAILLLHGSGGGTDFWTARIAPFISQLDFALFVVHYLDATNDSRAQVSQLTDGVHVPLWLEAARKALDTIRTHPAVDPARIALVGISLGAFMSLALGTEASPHPPLRGIVDISGGLVPPWAAQASSVFPPTLILHGDADTIVPVAQAHALDQTLTRLGVAHEMHILCGEGHWFSPPAALQILTNIAAFLKRTL